MAGRVPTVYFAGTGTLLLFSLGVAKYLKEHYQWGDASVLTVSGGGIPSLALLTLAPAQFDTMAQRIAKLFADLPGGLARVLHSGEYYQRALRYLLKPEVLPFLRDRLLIKTTLLKPCITPIVYNGPYETVDEVTGKLCASAYIPFLFFMRLPWPGHMFEVDGALGTKGWKTHDWPNTVVVGPSFTGNEDVWFQRDNWLDEIRPLSYFEQISLYNLGYKRAYECRSNIERKIGAPVR
jgi:hypothetical protein